MYLFLQYYRQFTPKALKEFYEEDSRIRDIEMSLVSGKEALRSASRINSAMSGRKIGLIEKPLENQPFEEIMYNFKESFQNAFEHENPEYSIKYYLSNIFIVQIATKRFYDILFSFAFLKDTTHEINYASSDLTKKLMK